MGPSEHCEGLHELGIRSVDGTALRITNTIDGVPKIAAVIQ
jgi:hypothetical protein